MPVINFRWWKIHNQTEAIKQNGVHLSGAEQKLLEWCNGILSGIGLDALGMTQCVVIVSLVLGKLYLYFFSIHREWYIIHLKTIISYCVFLQTRLALNYISFATQCKVLTTGIERGCFTLSICIYLLLAGRHISFVVYSGFAYDLASKVTIIAS